jgi:type IV secretion system protein VirB11
MIIPANKSVLEPVLRQGVFIEKYLTPFRAYLLDNNVSEICVNHAHELWIERAGISSMEQIRSPGISEDHLLRLARQIAALSGQAISEEFPLLSATLPTGERVQIVIPPAARFGPAFSIRKQVVQDVTLSEFEGEGAFESAIIREAPLHKSKDDRLRKLATNGQLKDFICAAAKARKNILISGGTSTGKTTLLNAILAEIDENERIITIEDTPEVRPKHRNHLSLLASKGEQGTTKVTIQDLLEASLRLRPDRILLGELRGKEAYTFLRAINTGHPGSLTTVHADTPFGAVEQIALMVMQAGLGLTHDQIKTYITNIIDIVIQLRRIGGKRVISEIWYPE